MPENMLEATGLYRISNNYYTIYATLALELVSRKPPYTKDEKAVIRQKMNAVREVAEYFSELADESLVVDVKMPVSELSKSIKDANEVIKDLKVAGKVLKVIADLVLIGGTLLLVVADPPKLTVLPGQVGNLIEDVNAIRSA